MNLKHTRVVRLFFMCLILCFTGCATQSCPPGDDSEENRQQQERNRQLQTRNQELQTQLDQQRTRNQELLTQLEELKRKYLTTEEEAVFSFVPVTSEIVDEILILDRNPSNSDLTKLKFRLSIPVSIVPIRNSVSTNGRVDEENGALIRREQNDSPGGDPLKINSDDDGILSSIESGIIKVTFKGHQLSFRRNGQGFYELFSVVAFGVEPNAIEGSPRPLLHIKVQERRQEIQAVPNPTSGGGQRPIGNDQPPVRDNRGPYYQHDTNSNPSNNRSRPIMSRGLLNPDVVAAYITRNYRTFLSHENVRILIDKYFEEAAFEGVNHDIAIAQMLYWTNYLRNQERVSSRNYGGLSPTSTWRGRFGDMTTGVRAHIQHLRWYASPPIRRSNVDPRYDTLRNLRYLGSASTFGQLYEKWSPNNYRYGNNIDRILNELYDCSTR